ncbi:MAG: GNAT family N-acetyltransferase [Alphaproteobacteria bacterium]|nr:MAG: GNAT family N-acetyltransferase [Alphaproteobacteria bacterium]
MGLAGRHPGRNRTGRVTVLEDTITYLEMLARPTGRRVPAPLEKLALMHAEACTVSFYRYLYDTVGEPWLWFERRMIGDLALAAQIHKPTIEIFVLYVRGVPAGFFELDTAAARETKLCYFGLIPDFIGRRLGPYLLQAAIDRAWSRPIDRFWLHTSTFDHPKALRVYQRAGFVVYARRAVTFDDPREHGLLPRTLSRRRSG